MSLTTSAPRKTYLNGTLEETQLFGFASDSFIDRDYDNCIDPHVVDSVNPLDDLISSGLFNLRKMALPDIGHLLRGSSSPIRNSSDEYKV
jgi:hypothetical protein